jgi:hypothetical protein
LTAVKEAKRATEIIATMDPSTDIRSERDFSRARKLVYFSAALVVGTAVMAARGGYPEPEIRQPSIMLLYVGAEDCAPCRAWRNGEGAAFLASAESGRISFREVKAWHLQDVLKDENWPEDIRPLRSEIGRSDGVPLWLIVADHEIVEQQFGASAWQQRVLPKIRSYWR